MQCSGFGWKMKPKLWWNVFFCFNQLVGKVIQKLAKDVQEKVGNFA